MERTDARIFVEEGAFGRSFSNILKLTGGGSTAGKRERVKL